MAGSAEELQLPSTDVQQAVAHYVNSRLCHAHTDLIEVVGKLHRHVGGGVASSSWACPCSIPLQTCRLGVVSNHSTCSDEQRMQEFG